MSRCAHWRWRCIMLDELATCYRVPLSGLVISYLSPLPGFVTCCFLDLSGTGAGAGGYEMGGAHVALNRLLCHPLSGFT